MGTQETSSTQVDWRKLALQFDSHRMRAIWHLRAMVQDPVAHKASAEAFLAAPPGQTTKELSPVTAAQAMEALDSLDDYARMGVAVNAMGPRGVLERFIAQSRPQ